MQELIIIWLFNFRYYWESKVMRGKEVWGCSSVCYCKAQDAFIWGGGGNQNVALYIET